MTAAPTEPRSPSSHEVDVADLAYYYGVQRGKPTSIAEEHRVPAAPGS